ncbi:hypothetical protein GGF50DRAFT_50058 [Schizophyllum commune]
MNKGHQYEVSLYGVFSPVDLKAILDRMTLHSESSAPLHLREVVFEPLVRPADAPVDQGILHAQKDTTEDKSSWVLYSYLKPESSRVYPEAMVRPWATCLVQGDGLAFASALGYVRRSEVYKRGFVFRRNGRSEDSTTHTGARRQPVESRGQECCSSAEYTRTTSRQELDSGNFGGSVDDERSPRFT